MTNKAALQHGVVASWQFAGLLSAKAIRWELFCSGRWERLGRHVVRLRGAPETEASKISAAVLLAGPGARLCLASAARHWGWPNFASSPVHVQRKKSTNTVAHRGDSRLHESRRVPAGQLAFHDGVLVTTPSRTLVDIAAVLHRDRLALLLDWAWNRRQLTGHTVLSCLAQIGSRGRHGVAALRELIEERGQHYSPPATGLESRAAAVLRRHGYCGAVSQVNVGGRVWLGRVDLLVGSRVVVEVQSDLFHSSLTSREDDEARFDALGEAGFEVVEVWESDLWQGDAWVVRVARALAGTNRVVPAPR